MAAGGYDRLSELSDDILRRVLHFAPLKEAASTTALSRRWRAPLWLSSGALNLETGVETNIRFFSRSDDVVTAAAGALDAADVPVTRLTLRHEKYNVASPYYYTDMANDVLSHPAVRGVEELRLVAKDPKDYKDYGSREGLYKVTLDSLPLETLRVLELHNCTGISYKRHHAVLPQLSSLRLSYCRQHLGSLQDIIDDAPVLAAVRLKSVVMDATEEKGKEETTRRLRCPAANVLVLDSCEWHVKLNYGGTFSRDHYKKTVYVDEINAPRLRRFTYNGELRAFTFSPPPLELEQVDLHFFRQVYETYEYEWTKKDPNRDLETFWRSVRSFTSTKEMRLRVNDLEDIAVLSKAWRVKLLPAFRRLEHLDVQGVHSKESTTATVTTILNLLRCCPVLRALRINLTAKREDASNRKEGLSTRPQKENQITSMLGSSHFSQCLKSSLKGVGLQLRLEKSDCLGEKLIKFFAEKAMVLEEMRINDGDEKVCEHMNPKIEKWNSKRRKIGATSFVVLPLQSRFYHERKI